MAQGELDRLRSRSFSAGIQTRLLEVDETIACTRPSEVAFYEAAFQVGLRLPIHRTFRRILAYYNVCLTKLALNAWRMDGDNAKEKNAGDEAHAKGKPKKGWPQEEALDISPMKNGKQAIDAKKKRPMPSPNDKKKGHAAKAPTKYKTTLGCATTRDVPTFVALRKGTSVNPGVVLGLETSALDNPAIEENLL
ncbi:hypothetical protein Acr_18g0008150 [Actinidia rufa]|uniref:Uncharacterized protein n=1 Tax=Actinidia rufa TaxID=165716 RepID=A0A7J0G776_9ERIC|nr:hypothetical protein Acr_18g0008150 [Actinidia rufa]